MRNLCPQTLTTDEQRTLLLTTTNVRDNTIFSLALGTGLRLGELVGLNVSDIYFPTGDVRGRIRVRAEIAKRSRTGDAFLPDALIPKLAAHWGYKLDKHESMDPDAPLFCALSRRRLSPRRIQVVFRYWPRRGRARLGRLYPFHGLRHTAVTNVYRASRDLFLAQRFARHALPLTTVIDTHPSDEELRGRVRDLAC